MTRKTTAIPDPASLFSLPTSSLSSSMTPSTPSPSLKPAGPEPTHPPPGAAKDEQQQPRAEEDVHHDEVDNGPNGFKTYKLRLLFKDLRHPGATYFLAAVDPLSILDKNISTILQLLYQKPSHKIPPTRSVTLYLEQISDGTPAFSLGSELDPDHKEIHFSLGYIEKLGRAPQGANGDTAGAHEIAGVLIHELVHCFQYDGGGTCPMGLIEGVADWVRLRAHLAPPHWNRRHIPKKWDDGYQHTAFFLDWLEEKKGGAGSVPAINEGLRQEKYEKDKFWIGLFGAPVESLWQDYLVYLEGFQQSSSSCGGD